MLNLVKKKSKCVKKSKSSSVKPVKKSKPSSVKPVKKSRKSKKTKSSSVKLVKKSRKSKKLKGGSSLYGFDLNDQIGGLPAVVRSLKCGGVKGSNLNKN